MSPSEYRAQHFDGMLEILGRVTLVLEQQSPYREFLKGAIRGNLIPPSPGKTPAAMVKVVEDMDATVDQVVSLSRQLLEFFNKPYPPSKRTP